MNKLTIATFNLNKDEGEFPDRIYGLSNIIYKNRFDIICLQEDYNSSRFSSSKFLNLELDYNYISTKSREKNRNGVNSSSNLTVLSKYEIKLLDEIYFHKGKEEERTCQFLEIEYNDYKVLLVNTHLCHLSLRNRNEQIKTILEKINSIKKHDILLFCGDFNAIPSYPEIEKIKEFGFKDINNEFTHEDKVILDYIFYKTYLKTKIDSKVLLKGFSDHHCLVNTIRF